MDSKRFSNTVCFDLREMVHVGYRFGQKRFIWVGAYSIYGQLVVISNINFTLSIHGQCLIDLIELTFKYCAQELMSIFLISIPLVCLTHISNRPAQQSLAVLLLNFQAGYACQSTHKAPPTPPVKINSMSQQLATIYLIKGCMLRIGGVVYFRSCRANQVPQPVMAILIDEN